METDVSDRWSIARGKVEDILALRLHGCGANPGPWAQADARKEHLMLVLEIERQRAADRQAEALEKLASGMNALVATIKNLGLTVEDLADHDQGELFRIVDDPGPCACGKDHSEVD